MKSNTRKSATCFSLFLRHLPYYNILDTIQIGIYTQLFIYYIIILYFNLNGP